MDKFLGLAGPRDIAVAGLRDKIIILVVACRAMQVQPEGSGPSVWIRAGARLRDNLLYLTLVCFGPGLDS